MSVWTLFARLQASLSNGDDTNPDTSDIYTDASSTARHNVLYYRRETLDLDDTETRAITFPNYSTSQWVLILARVVGNAKITTVGVDADGVTAIQGDTAGYGTVDHPGIIGMTTYNVTSFTLESLADSTSVEYLACIIAEDDQV
jgi:hypothetical protein